MLEKLEIKEQILRECFKKQLEKLNEDGANNIADIRSIKLYGALWHYTNELLKKEEMLVVKSDIHEHLV